MLRRKAEDRHHPHGLLLSSLIDFSMPAARYPSLYQVNTRVLLSEIGSRLGRPATFDDLPDTWLEDWAGLGFDWIWFLGVWQTGPAGQAISRQPSGWRQEFLHTLPDLTDDDICGSPFAISNYDVHADFGGDAALARLRERMEAVGLKLLLDFVPNHSAPDHPWVRLHPEFYIHGSEDDLAREPYNYARVETDHGPRILAYGRDPYFAGWTDTLQFNYRHPGLRAGMLAELSRVADRCDGVRCDMSMLLLPDVIERTWGHRSHPVDGSEPVADSFWQSATAAIRSRRPGFVFMAEVYWDLEWTLQQQGFDYTYDKRLYDRLRDVDTHGVRDHLRAGMDFQDRLVRFMENHDEPRVAEVFDWERHQAAAVISFLVPGLRFLHEGQFEGRRVRVPVHLRRRPEEPPQVTIGHLYQRLLLVLGRDEVRSGTWQLYDTHRLDGYDNRLIAMTWSGPDGQILLTAVNYGWEPGEFRVGTFVPPPSRSLSLLLSEPEPTLRWDDGWVVQIPPWGYGVWRLMPSNPE